MDGPLAGNGTRDQARLAAVGGALGAALLYLLIGIGVVSVGSAASGKAPDLLSFGLMAGGTFAVIAALLFRFQSRILWVAVAVLQVAVIAAYFAMSNIRTPPIEPWGLLVKACQVVVLVGVAVLLVRGRRDPAR